MMDWVERALAQKPSVENHCQKGPKATTDDSVASQIDCQKGPKGSFVSFGSEIDTASFSQEQTAAFVSEAPARIAAPTLSQRGMMCRVCHRVDRCYADAEGVVCPACAEWEVRGCPGFAVLTTADVEAERRFGACLRCGSPWSMHGCPEPDGWTRHADLDDVAPAATRFVLARAREIARGTEQ